MKNLVDKTKAVRKPSSIHPLFQTIFEHKLQVLDLEANLWEKMNLKGPLNHLHCENHEQKQNLAK